MASPRLKGLIDHPRLESYYLASSPERGGEASELAIPPVQYTALGRKGPGS